MQKLTLSGEWQFRQCGTNEWLPATVPGGVHTDLLALGKIPDPFVADNELKVMWVAETDWEYRRSFTVNAELLAEENVNLVCDGLDTIADVYLNGTYLGHAENMFRRWEWDVKSLLKRRQQRAAHYLWLTGALYHCQTSAASPAGRRRHPWRAAPAQGTLSLGLGLGSQAAAHRRLEGDPARRIFGPLRECPLAAKSEAGWRRSSALTSRSRRPAGLDRKVFIKVTGPDGDAYKAKEVLSPMLEGETCFAYLAVEIPNPQLWWPNGYGAQPLYEVEVTLKDGKNVLDHRTYKIGLRTDRAPPGTGPVGQGVHVLCQRCASLRQRRGLDPGRFTSHPHHRVVCWKVCSRAPSMPT